MAAFAPPVITVQVAHQRQLPTLVLREDTPRQLVFMILHNAQFANLATIVCLDRMEKLLAQLDRTIQTMVQAA
jgi:hypothetical protein